MSPPAGSGRAREPRAASQAGLAEELAARGIVLGRRLGEGSLGATWRAHESDPRGPGRAVAVKRVGGLGRSAGRLARRLEVACQLREPHLLHFLSAFSVRGSVVVVSPLDEGVPLSRLAAGRNLPRACALAVGLGVLNALTSLHQAGLWHGALHPGNVHVGRDGSVRLGHFALTPAFPEQSPAALRTADVRAAGALLCALLGIDAGAPRRGVKAARAAGTPIGAAALAMAHAKESRSGYEAARGSLMLWEAGGRLAASRRQAQAKEQLAHLVATEQGEAPAAPPPPVAAPAPPGPPQAEGLEDAPAAPGPPWRGVAAGAASLAACAIMTVLSFHLPGLPAAASRPGDRPPPAGVARVPSPAPQVVAPAPSVSPAPPPAPRAAGAVEAVTASVAAGPCAPGATCAVGVRVSLKPSPLPRRVTWTLGVLDACTGRFDPLLADSVQARPGWTSVLDTTSLAVPRRASGWLVAVVHAPAAAMSGHLPLGPAPAC